MLYLFGRLALSDSLDYHENFQDDDFLPTTCHERSGRPEPEARATALDRPARPCPQPVPAGPGC